MKKTFVVLMLMACIQGCSSSPPETSMEINQKRFAEVTARVDKAVSDPERATALKEIVDKLDHDLLAHKHSLESKRDAIVAASADYSTPRAELERLYAEVDAELLIVFSRLKEAYLALTVIATPEEWEAITKGKKRLFGFE